ncbi:ABC transporter [Halorubrum sp. BOL3-1]|uniref:ABC transporter permease n=1 Tax=Halorubrum sp. BOL3-1 TaxID=2497325 RepID=UPI001004D761|nr:ABC transporter permease subunit [Halorubrum sp. BOL3-1]QAU14097.1 ABC transporter [Halorubrum sp. BOL3-1]
MSIETIARKDLADASRSKMLWVVAVLVLLSTAGVTGLIAVTTGMPAREVFGIAFQLAVTTLPIIALILAKGAITGERESGSLRVLLSLPPSRSDVLVGKLLGRTVLMLAATLVSGLATGLVVLALLGGGIGVLVPFVGFLGLMGIVFVAIGVGVSAASATDNRATAIAVGAYMILVALWNLIEGGIQFGAVELGLMEAGSQPAWLQLVGLLPPNNAAIAAFRATVEGQIFGTDPFASVWLPVCLLLIWFVFPVAGGYLSFRDAQIG